MNNKTPFEVFGDYLKKYRLRRNLTQDELSAEIHVKKITVSRWERGIQRPNDVLSIQLISQKLTLSYLEEHSLLVAAGFILPTKMPRLEQIKLGLAPYIKDIQTDIFPSVIIDYHFTRWVLSPSAVSVGGYEQTIQEVSSNPSLFSPIFNSTTVVHYSHQNTATQIAQIKLFFVMNALRKQELWFRNYPNFIHNILTYDGYLIFKHIWNSITNDVERGKINIFSDALKSIDAKPTVGENELVRWKQRIDILPDLPQFAIMRFLPVDKESVITWIKSKQNADTERLISLWDMYNDTKINTLIKSYLTE